MSLQQAREARERAVVAFAKFTKDANSFCDKFFCFFEGEDYKYYRERIEAHSHYSFENIIHYNCSGRSEVLRAFRLIEQKAEYASIKTAFFIDRDYIPEQNLPHNVYQTPCYAIENFYTSVASFKRMLNEEFGISTTDNDYVKCVKDYEERQHDFHERTLVLNAWLRFQREEEQRTHQYCIDLRAFKLQQLFTCISIEKVECNCAIDIPKVISLFPQSHAFQQEIFDKIVEEYQKADGHIYFRGKFEMLLYQRIVLDLREKNRLNTYFSEKRPCVYIDPNINALSSLSKYADTPTCLIEFLSHFAA